MELNNSQLQFINDLRSLINKRKLATFDQNPSNSYVTSLFAAGLSRIAQKVGEEAVEVVIASLEYGFTQDDFTEDDCINQPNVSSEGQSEAGTREKTTQERAMSREIINENKLQGEPSSNDQGNSPCKASNVTSSLATGNKDYLRTKLIGELADLFFHSLVLLEELDISPSEIIRELEARKR